MERFPAYVIGTVELTDERRRHIISFHPDVWKYKSQFKTALAKPYTVRRSKYDPLVFIYYGRMRPNKFLAIVIKSNSRKFILTAYLTDRIQHQHL